MAGGWLHDWLSAGLSRLLAGWPRLSKTALQKVDDLSQPAYAASKSAPEGKAQ
jgi:hypothetical protein